MEKSDKESKFSKLVHLGNDETSNEDSYFLKTKHRGAATISCHMKSSHIHCSGGKTAETRWNGGHILACII